MNERCTSISPTTGARCIHPAGHQIRHCGPPVDGSPYRERWGAEPAGGYATGGVVTTTTYMIGETGPEVVTLPQGGHVRRYD
jgi:hypothetical protein